jgi:hypothetical protein
MKNDSESPVVNSTSSDVFSRGNVYYNNNYCIYLYVQLCNLIKFDIFDSKKFPLIN